MNVRKRRLRGAVAATVACWLNIAISIAATIGGTIKGYDNRLCFIAVVCLANAIAFGNLALRLSEEDEK